MSLTLLLVDFHNIIIVIIVIIIIIYYYYYTHHDTKLIQKMFDVSEEVSIQSGLEVKPEKCALLYARRSGKNWYNGKNDVTPSITVQGNVLETYGRSYSYKYLGKSLSLSGEDSAQVE